MNAYPARNIRLVRTMHLGFAVFGIAAWLTAEGAEDAAGFWLHASPGLALAFVMALRLLTGIAGGPPLAFAGWSPLDVRQWKAALADLGSLVRLRVPSRAIHEGAAGLLQAGGIALFATMALTGTLMLLLGERAHALEEVHEVGETLIPAFLALHVGAVALHSLAGRPIWQKMFAWSGGVSQHGDQAGEGRRVAEWQS